MGNFSRMASLIGLVAALAQPEGAAAQLFFPGNRQVEARIWVDDLRDYYRAGDRMNLRFTVTEDAYVAVVHIDTYGNLDFVYPASPWDNEFVRGRQIHTVATRGTNSRWTVSGRSGIGYLYLIASPSPLDFSYFRGRS